jgi:hypothetical protein
MKKNERMKEKKRKKGGKERKEGKEAKYIYIYKYIPTLDHHATPTCQPLSSSNCHVAPNHQPTSSYRF